MDQLSLLECSICGESFDCVERKPKLLPCCHTFCLSCLLEISARDGAGARCPADEGLINADDPRNLKDNQQIMPWLKDPKTLLEMKARLAEHRELKLMRGCRDALVLEMQRQVAALLQQRPEAGNSKRGAAAAKLDKELKLLTCCETVSIASDTWRVEGAELEKQPALRIAMLLLLQQGALRNLQQQQQQQQQEQQHPAPLVELNLALYKHSGPNEFREEKVALLQSDIAVEALTGVCLDSDPHWVQSLLWRHSKTIQELQVECDANLYFLGPSADVLVLASMPRLRKLVLYSVQSGLPDSRQWLGRLQSLKALDCGVGVAASVLKAHRDTLQEVDLGVFGRLELLELQHMPALTKLALRSKQKDDDTALPEQWLGQLTVLHFGSLTQATELSLLKAHRNSLQEVRVSVVSRDSLLELQQMPELRKLTVTKYDEDQPDDPALSALWPRQLQFLDMRSNVPQARLLSLLTALSASLQELSLSVGMPPESEREKIWPDISRDLLALLRQCNLQRLRTLTLRRWGCSRNRTACQTQRDAVSAILPGCKVICSNRSC